MKNSEHLTLSQLASEQGLLLSELEHKINNYTTTFVKEDISRERRKQLLDLNHQVKQILRSFFNN